MSEEIKEINMSNTQKYTAILRQKNENFRWFREGDDVPLSPIFTNIQAAVDYPKRNPLLSDDEWQKGENVVIPEPENRIVGLN